MNHVAKEINDILNGEDSLAHYGMPRRSGRYPWGSGDDPYQRDNRDFLGRIDELRKGGWTENADNVRKEFNMSLNEYRTKKSIARAERDNYNIATAKAMREDGLGDTEIGRRMGVNESTVRGWLDRDRIQKVTAARNTANFIKERIDSTGKMVDVGKGVELELNVSREKLNQAIKLLEEEGYVSIKSRVQQPTNPSQMTTLNLIAPPGTPKSAGYKNLDDVVSLKEYVSHDRGETFDKFVYPKSIDSKRIKVLLHDDIGPDGEKGVDKDGLIQIRRGVEDLSLGNDRYAQVRILVDDTKYLKGMAVYSDNMPDGYDIVFNSNKKTVDAAFKAIKDDPDNPFGSLLKDPGGQSYYFDKDGNRQLSAINKTRAEGDWDEWSDATPSQFLAKQPLHLAKKQLKLAVDDKLAEYEEICSLTNPTVKKHYLDKFAENCDSAAEKLQAAALPGQKHHVIIPINTLKDNEVYAPGYENGTQLALVRYPHGGIFEIPILTVNNKNATGKRVIGTDPIDAIGINKKVADQLSGADFDGDTAMCIPTNNGKVKIQSRPPLEQLKDFDTRDAYPPVEGMSVMKKGSQTQKEMGMISNLITDMTIKGASWNELASAVKHSMVVIDAAKHKLNYKKSEVDNNIQALRDRYQQHLNEDGELVKTGGASTLLSRAKGDQSVIKSQGTPKVNVKGESWYDPDRPEGALIYQTSDNAYYPVRQYDKKTGLTTIKTANGKKVTYDAKDPAQKEKYDPVKVVDADGRVRFTNKAGDIDYKTDYRKRQSTKMAETDDARTLISDYNSDVERAYADYANTMKSLANQARLESYYTKEINESPSAKKVYAEEVKSLQAKLKLAGLNNPRERLATVKANVRIAEKKQADPDMDKDAYKKLKTQEMNRAREEVGAIARKKREIQLTDREWEAIQAGAIGHTKLRDILNNTNPDDLRARSMPRKNNNVLSNSQVSRAKSLSNSGYTLKEIAKKLGVSTSTVSKYLKGEN